MIRALHDGRVASSAVLLVFWVVLWRRITLGVVLSGLVFAVLSVLLIPTPGRPGAIRWTGVARLMGHVTGQLVLATLKVAWEVVTPGDQTRPGVVPVELAGAAEAHLTLVSLLITLTPGTFVVDVDLRRRLVIVHLLHLSDEEAARREVAELYRRVQEVWRQPRLTSRIIREPSEERS